MLTKSIGDDRRDPSDVDHAIRQIVSRAVSSDEVIDIFAAAELKKPDISVHSDEFLGEVRGLKHRNLAMEMLRKLLQGEIKQRSKKNVVQARSFLEMLERSIARYQNRAIETALIAICQLASARHGRSVSRDVHERRRQAHAEKMATAESKARDGRRFHAAEVPFAILKHIMDLRRFLLRGIDNVRTEWLWGCTAYNLKNMIGGVARLRAQFAEMNEAGVE